MKRKFGNFSDLLSRDEMRSIIGGYNSGWRDESLWGGQRWYSCNCSSGGSGPFSSYMGTNGDYADVTDSECGHGNHMTCSY